MPYDAMCQYPEPAYADRDEHENEGTRSLHDVEKDTMTNKAEKTSLNIVKKCQYSPRQSERSHP
eukprot:5135013-Pyramimonas_sp.AAC.1